MKKIICALLIIFFTVNVHAQLINTKWKTTFQLDELLPVVFNFSEDTLRVTRSADNSDLETMIYATSDTVLTLQKLYGQSECDTTKGMYAFKITGNELWLHLISDACTNRSGVIKDIKLTKTE